MARVCEKVDVNPKPGTKKFPNSIPYLHPLGTTRNITSLTHMAWCDNSAHIEYEYVGYRKISDKSSPLKVASVVTSAYTIAVMEKQLFIGYVCNWRTAGEMALGWHPSVEAVKMLMISNGQMPR